MVREPFLFILDYYITVYDLAKGALARKTRLKSLISQLVTNKALDYNSIYNGKSDWKLLPAFDHPGDIHKCVISGTGLTHKASADGRQKMHEAEAKNELTDSMKMYLKGLEGGRPENGYAGVQPEWFYKGNGATLRGHLDALEVPLYGIDGGEEAEIAGAYLVSENGVPYRIGFLPGNEFSDHVLEKENYLYLACSKLRECAIGPEILITDNLEEVIGQVSIYRDGHLVWEKSIASGEKHMAHSIANLEFHHFKFPNNRLPGQAHIHFLGAAALSFGSGIMLEPGDEMVIHWDGFGRPLRNTLQVSVEGSEYFAVMPLA